MRGTHGRVLAAHAGSLVWRNPIESDREVSVVSDSMARSWLRRFLRVPGGVDAMRRALASVSVDAQLSRSTDADVLEDAARALSRGRLVAVVASLLVPVPKEVPRDEIAAPPPLRVEKKVWIAIKLLDDADPPNPVPNERYQVTLADQSVKTGRLDAQGYAYIDGVDPGTCQISFPDLHGPDWARA